MAEGPRATEAAAPSGVVGRTAPDPRASRGRRAGRWLLAAAALSVVVGLAIEPQTVAEGERRYVIPPGTAQRIKAGQSVADVMPQHVETVVGRPLVVRNDDAEAHVIGPFVLEPGQSWRRTFAVAGDVQLACSLYPTTGFTVAVAEPPAPAVRATALLSAWLALLTLATAAAAGAAGAALGLGGGDAVGSTVGDVARQRPPPVAATARGVAGAALESLPPLLFGTAAVEVLRLTRTARWIDVLRGAPLFVWGFALACALGAAWFGRRLGAAPAIDRPGASPMADGVPWSPVGDALAGVGLALLAIGGAWAPLAGPWAAPVAAVATAGGGLLGAAAVLATRVDGAARRRLAVGVAAPGLALLAIALPSGSLTPPAQAVVALPKLAAALGVLWLARRRFRLPDRAAAQALLAEGALGLLFTGGLFYGALLSHLNAVTLPLVGNAVSMSAESARRGADLWAANCSACHTETDRARYAALPTERLLSAMTFGTAAAAGSMPAFKYRLDVFERGDVVNYVRGSSPPR